MVLAQFRVSLRRRGLQKSVCFGDIVLDIPMYEHRGWFLVAHVLGGSLASSRNIFRLAKRLIFRVRIFKAVQIGEFSILWFVHADIVERYCRRLRTRLSEVVAREW